MARAVGMTNERDEIMRMVLAVPALCFGVGWLLVVVPHCQHKVENLQEEFRLKEVKR